MKGKKKELLNLVDTLEEANQAIKHAGIRELDGMASMLADCQMAAMEIGKCLESLGEQTESIVKVLEEYCESIYQQSIHLNEAEQCRKIAKKIQKQLGRIDSAIRYDLPEDQREVVFLPYKAAMWDSLESMYLEEREKEHTTAYVIPIPYFDKNPDGTLGTMHEESGEYPAGIPITDWRQYNLRERRPDTIYIHNPYDSWNYVTSISPMFYANHLKEYTEELVYVPYFIFGEIDTKDKDTIERVKHFCFLPGTIYADKVILESDAVRKFYINEYLRAAKENGMNGCHTDRTYLEQKFLGNGSPKYQKVLQTGREDVQIPEGWSKMLIKPDGTAKKVVFYNTGIKTILENERKVLDKIKETLETFARFQKEICLLWRPHPLLENTLKVMRPLLLQEYKKLVEHYRQEGWGIYDDTADMNRAVALSDAYYGDNSSIVPLFQEVCKPVLLADYQE